MPVFISWSGDQSERLAMILGDFLPRVIQRLKVFVSSTDIAAGDRWFEVVEHELQQATFGIICVTRENLRSPWLNFEAGAISNRFIRPRVVPLLLNLSNSDVGSPLSMFMMKSVSEKDLYALIESINEGEGDNGVDQQQLKETFDLWWERFGPKFTQLVNTVAHQEGTKPVREVGEILTEILTLVRTQSSSVRSTDYDSTLGSSLLDFRAVRGIAITKANLAGLVVQDGRWATDPMLIVSDIGIDITSLRPGMMRFRIISDSITLIAQRVSKKLKGAIVIVDSDSRVGLPAAATYADKKGVGLAWLSDGKFFGTEVTRELAPWLVDEPLVFSEQELKGRK